MLMHIGRSVHSPPLPYGNVWLCHSVSILMLVSRVISRDFSPIMTILLGTLHMRYMYESFFRL